MSNINADLAVSRFNHNRKSDLGHCLELADDEAPTEAPDDLGAAQIRYFVRDGEIAVYFWSVAQQAWLTLNATVAS